MPVNNSMFDDESSSLTKERVDEPKMYKVILHNDNYTTMDFVVKVLVVVFHFTEPDANKIMMDVHKKGRGICGVFTKDIAATKTRQVMDMAEAEEFPLRCSYEEA